MGFQKGPIVNPGSIAGTLNAINQSTQALDADAEFPGNLIRNYMERRKADNTTSAQEAFRLGNEVPDSLFGINEDIFAKYTQAANAEERSATAEARTAAEDDFTRSLDPFKLNQEKYKSETAKEKLDIMGVEELRAQAKHVLDQSTNTIKRDSARLKYNQYGQELTALRENLNARTGYTTGTTAKTTADTSGVVAQNVAAKKGVDEETATTTGLTGLGEQYDSTGNTSPDYRVNFNALYRNEVINKGNKNASTRLKPLANEMAAADGNNGSAITEASIRKRITDPNDNNAYTESLFNQVVNDEFKRLRKDNLYADPAVLRKAAIASVDRTSAGVKFREQTWYDKQTRPEKWRLEEQDRVKNLKTGFTATTKELVSAFDTFTKDKSDLNRTNFRSKLSDLTRQYEEDPESYSAGTLATINKWTNRALTDYTQNTFDPDTAYTERFQQQRRNDDLEVVKIPLGLGDYSPTNQRAFVQEETAKMKAEFPYADEFAIQKKLAARVANSGLAVAFAQGALPAKLKATAAKYRVEEEVDRIDRRNKRIKGMADDKGLQNHVYKNLTKRWIVEGEPLDQNQASKLRKELHTTIGNWKGFIPNWKKLHPESKKTYEIAMAEVLSQAQIDKDLNFLWLDPDDYSLAAHGSSTGDMSGVKKNAALTALMQHISPYGVNAGGASNKSLITNLTDSIMAFNTKEVAKQDARIDDIRNRR